MLAKIAKFRFARACGTLRRAKSRLHIRVTYEERSRHGGVTPHTASELGVPLAADDRRRTRMQLEPRTCGRGRNRGAGPTLDNQTLDNHMYLPAVRQPTERRPAHRIG
jgi:hypothetical protein